MNVLMVGVDTTSLGGMLTVVENYLNNEKFCKQTNLIYIPVTTHAPLIKKILFGIKAFIRIAITIRSKNIDIVHVHMSDGGSAYREGLILLTAKKMGCHTIAHMHAADYENWYESRNSAVKRLVSYLLQKADVVIALGEKWKQVYECVTKQKSKVIVLYNAVPVPCNNLYNANSHQVLFLAHMIKRKGIDDLLESIREVRNSIPADIRFVLYGADREGNILQKIASKDIGSIVEYKGWLDASDREACLRETIINVLPSYHEGLPMTILETMAFGIPNIATDIAAIPEAIENGMNGVLINPGDKEALSGAMKVLLNNRELREKYSNNSYITVKNRFSLDVHMERLMNVYKELLHDEESV